MHSALVVVEKPKPLLPGADWHLLLAAIKDVAEKYPSVEELGDGCCLVTLSDGDRALAELLQIAQHCAHRVLFFKKPPAWVHTRLKSA